jgi:polyisoprenoid-binding protein YceI
VISKVRGSFDKFDGMINLDPHDVTGSSVEISIETASINTSHEKRDGHLKSDEFLDVANHPTITFKSSAITKTDKGLVAVGTLTIRGVAKEVKVPFELQGPINDPWGNELIVATLEFEINRHDFGVSWSKKLDNGGLVVSDKIKIHINVEATKVQ